MEKTDRKTNTRYKKPEEKRTERMKIAVNPEEKNQLILNAEKYFSSHDRKIFNYYQ